MTPNTSPTPICTTNPGDESTSAPPCRRMAHTLDSEQQLRGHRRDPISCSSYPLFIHHLFALIEGHIALGGLVNLLDEKGPMEYLDEKHRFQGVLWVEASFQNGHVLIVWTRAGLPP